MVVCLCRRSSYWEMRSSSHIRCRVRFARYLCVVRHIRTWVLHTYLQTPLYIYKVVRYLSTGLIQPALIISSCCPFLPSPVPSCPPRPPTPRSSPDPSPKPNFSPQKSHSGPEFERLRECARLPAAAAAKIGKPTGSLMALAANMPVERDGRESLTSLCEVLLTLIVVLS